MPVPAAVTMRLPRTATALTYSGRCSRARSKVVSASRQTRTVPSSPPVTMTVAPSAITRGPPHSPGRCGRAAVPHRGAVSQPPYSLRAVDAGDDDQGAIQPLADRQ